LRLETKPKTITTQAMMFLHAKFEDKKNSTNPISFPILINLWGKQIKKGVIFYSKSCSSKIKCVRFRNLWVKLDCEIKIEEEKRT
jgi:hypothetical protein